MAIPIPQNKKKLLLWIATILLSFIAGSFFLSTRQKSKTDDDFNAFQKVQALTDGQALATARSNGQDWIMLVDKNQTHWKVSLNELLNLPENNFLSPDISIASVGKFISILFAPPTETLKVLVLSQDTGHVSKEYSFDFAHDIGGITMPLTTITTDDELAIYRVVSRKLDASFLIAIGSDGELKWSRPVDFPHPNNAKVSLQNDHIVLDGALNTWTLNRKDGTTTRKWDYARPRCRIGSTLYIMMPASDLWLITRPEIEVYAHDLNSDDVHLFTRITASDPGYDAFNNPAQCGSHSDYKIFKSHHTPTQSTITAMTTDGKHVWSHETQDSSPGQLTFGKDSESTDLLFSTDMPRYLPLGLITNTSEPPHNLTLTTLDLKTGTLTPTSPQKLNSSTPNFNVLPLPTTPRTHYIVTLHDTQNTTHATLFDAKLGQLTTTLTLPSPTTLTPSGIDSNGTLWLQQTHQNLQPGSIFNITD